MKELFSSDHLDYKARINTEEERTEFIEYQSEQNKRVLFIS